MLRHYVATGFALLALVLIGLDAALVPAANNLGPGRSDYLVTMGAGAIAAQVGLAATWFVFSARPILVRIGLCAVFGIVSFSSLAFGIAADHGEDLVVFAFLGCLPALFFAVQVPLWSARIWLRWEVTRVASTSRDSPAPPVTLKHLVVATSAAAVALALVRFASTFSDEPQDFMGAMLVQMMVLATVSFVLLPASLYFALKPKRFARALFGITTWFAFLFAIATMIVGLAVGAFPSPPKIIGCLLGVGSFATVMSAGLLLTRSDGHRLRWTGRAQAAD